MKIVSFKPEEDVAQSSDNRTLNEPVEQYDLLARKIEKHDEIIYSIMKKLGNSAGKLPQNHGEKVADTSHSGMRIPVLDFPRFNGENPKMWILECHGLFIENPVADWEKIQMAARHMDGEARQWYLSSVAEKRSITWAIFINLLMERFDASANFEGYIDTIRQEGPLDEYIRQFEELKVLFIFTYPDELIVNKFVRGLQDEIRHMVDMLAPLTLAQAIRIARKQEELHNAMMRAQLRQNRLFGTFRKWIREDWLTYLFPLFLVVISHLLPSLFNVMTAKLYRLFGWGDPRADREPPLGADPTTNQVPPVGPNPSANRVPPIGPNPIASRTPPVGRAKPFASHFGAIVSHLQLILDFSSFC
ncbi:hypothetical protein CDL12_27680 [Handroanthus impetiginosus]|uniref:Ty3 transposon capsid-like protein domain-containing protein n=1 Tax=Handroanthus impetiginosus TaxID=429701 RepID=A0A2G9G4I6_9LAMI|nr:hypothetical protein CDL12_27680 [Handroanthus impetiginosus]